MSSPTQVKSPWWQDDHPGTSAVAVARDLRSRDETRRIAYRVWDDLYDGRSLYSVENVEALSAIGRVAGLSTRTLNFARSAGEFIHAKVTAEVPSVRAAGHGADWQQHLKARKLSKFISGMYDDLEFELRVPESALVALRTGTGCVVVDTDSGRPQLSVVSPREFYVDADDGRHGDPRCLYWVHAMDRRALAATFPDAADRIMGVGATSDTTVGLYDPWYSGASEVDAVDRYECWYLPGQSDDGGVIPGRRVVALDDGTVLADHEWLDECFPVSFLRYNEHRPGTTFWGQGLMERLDGVQCEIDDAVSHIGRGIRENNLKIFVDDDGDTSPEVVGDPTVGTIIKLKTGARAPEFVVPSGASEQEVEWLKLLIGWLYQMSGMDQGAASSQKPAGINSGRALLYFHDFQSQRYVDFEKRLGRHVVEVVDRCLQAARRLTEADPSWTVRYAKGSVVRDIDFADVDMDRDQYVLELEEVSPVPDTFAGRLQQLEQDAAEGRIPQEYLASVREDPDTWWMARRSARADIDYVEWLIDALLDPDAPEPALLDEMDPQLAQDSLRSEVLNATVAGYDPSVVSRLQGYLARIVADQAAKAEQQAAQAQNPQAPGSPPAAQGGPPAAPGPGAPPAGPPGQPTQG